MSEKYLLLPSAKSAVLIRASRSRTHYLRLTLVAIGMLSVLVGAADLTSRLVQMAGPDAAFLAFAPAAAINNPALFDAPSDSGAIIPSRLHIPSLGVNAAVESVGKKADGTMGTPQDFDNVAWWSLGAKPGGPGSAVFAGHVNNALLKPGVFEHLSQIKNGDYITLEDSTGKTLLYRVSSVREYPADAPADDLFATSGPSKIVLITCNGDWVPSAGSFGQRLVVVAEPAY